MPPKPIQLIEYREGVQRTPQEAIDFLKERVDSGEVTHVILLYRNEDAAGWVFGSPKRDYKNSSILWDAIQWLREFTGGEE